MKRALLILVVGCGGDAAVKADAPAADAPVDVATHPVDARVDAPVDAAQSVRVFGNVNYNGSLPMVTVITLGSASQTAVTDADGNFYFDAPEGSPLIMEVLPPLASGLIPMIRGVIAEDHLRPREFYLMGPSDVSAAAALSKNFDPTKAIVETDFRNSAIGGYGTTLTGGSQPVAAGFGVVYDDNGNAMLGEQTVAGGDGSTLLLADLPPAEVSFAAVVPGAATLPCHTDGDAQPLPLLPGVTTWFDFECGSATD